MTCPTPNSISHGYFIGTKSTYSSGDKIYYFCDENYSLSGSATVTCGASGSWEGGYPSCSLSFLSNAYVIIIAVLILLVAVIALSVICVFCCKYCCWRKNRVHGDGEYVTTGCCACCKSRSNDTNDDVIDNDSTDENNSTKNSNKVTAKTGRNKVSPNKTTSSKANKKLSKTKGINVKKKTIAVRKKKIPTNSKDIGKSDKPTKEADEKQDSDLSVRKVAVEVDSWKPFTNPVRNINTSTK